MKIESVVLDQWYPVTTENMPVAGKIYHTRLLGQPIEYGLDEKDGFYAILLATRERLPVLMQHYTYWVSLGNPPDMFAISEFQDAERRVLAAASVCVKASGLRVVENFLDIAHFPFVHEGTLGEMPYTAVKPYRVEIENNEIYARDCEFYQPVAAFSHEGSMNIEYIYRVCSPFSALLYKTCPLQPAKKDVICLFVQPCDEDRSIVHMPMACLDDSASLEELRLFRQSILGEDMAILNNQIPRKLPLATDFEISTGADATSVAYRRWLSEKGVCYGAFQNP
ncbi:aromatic ring-hydroxylating dioxygenase subunit alpha [Advenella sp. RU8]|uniref:aromatic ring-hydroxylating dioxygenase subunit alpha n=1 Tax=Advenella sp. RU8 TaxID=3399575 RepID=UPI003AAFDA6A